jgi:hypothetical protein
VLAQVDVTFSNSMIEAFSLFAQTPVALPQLPGLDRAAPRPRRILRRAAQHPDAARGLLRPDAGRGVLRHGRQPTGQARRGPESCAGSTSSCKPGNVLRLMPRSASRPS